MSDEADIEIVIDCMINLAEDTIDFEGVKYYAKGVQMEGDPNHYIENPILKYFSYRHLQDRFAVVSKPFCDLAYLMDKTLPNGPEKSTALRKLLEAKDAAVRTIVD